MAKRKTNWKHVHKIRVHDNRWLIWTIAIAVLVCAGLIGYIQVSEIYFQDQMARATGSTSNWNTFNHPTGFSFKYPKNWGLESEGQSTISFVSPTNVNEYFSVSSFPESEERSIRASLFKTSEQEVEVGGLTGARISQSKNQPEEVVLINEGDRLLVLRGKGEQFSRILESFKFNQKLERI